MLLGEFRLFLAPGDELHQPGDGQEHIGAHRRGIRQEDRLRSLEGVFVSVRFFRAFWAVYTCVHCRDGRQV